MPQAVRLAISSASQSRSRSVSLRNDRTAGQGRGGASRGQESRKIFFWLDSNGPDVSIPVRLIPIRHCARSQCPIRAHQCRSIFQNLVVKQVRWPTRARSTPLRRSRVAIGLRRNMQPGKKMNFVPQLPLIARGGTKFGRAGAKPAKLAAASAGALVAGKCGAAERCGEV